MGVFELMDARHLHLLEQARGQCDRLVVGLRSDAGLQLTPNGSTIQPEAARAAVLASLSTVDLVCLFDEDTSLPLLEALRPDLLVKDADQAPKEEGATDQVQGWSGRVWLAELLDG